MSIFVIELDNGETGEDRIAGIGSNAFTNYLTATESLLEEGFIPSLIDHAMGGKPEYDLEFYMEDDEEVARIVKLNLVETV